VDQLSVDKALEVLSHRTGRMFDAPVGVTELSEYLVVLCGHLQTQRINAALAVDLMLNWLLNVYDKSVTFRSVAIDRFCVEFYSPATLVFVLQCTDLHNIM